MKIQTKTIIFIIFSIWTCFSIMVIPNIEIGLDQELTMSPESHVSKYFKYMAELLSMGPPVYWIFGTELPFHKIQYQNLFCGGPGCNNSSLATQLYLSSKNPEM